MEAYLHFNDGTRLTVKVSVRREYLWWQERGLSFTRTGYGRRIPTTYKVLHNGRWKRVYCQIYSNCGTCYIESKGKPVATVDIYQ